MGLGWVCLAPVGVAPVGVVGQVGVGPVRVVGPVGVAPVGVVGPVGFAPVGVVGPVGFAPVGVVRRVGFAPVGVVRRVGFAPVGVVGPVGFAPVGVVGRERAMDGLDVISNVTYAHRLSGPLLLDVYTSPDGARNPIIVSLHGGSGSKDDEAYVEFSRRLAAEDVVVFNVGYRGASPGGYAANDGLLLREALESVACAVRYARTHAERFGGDPQRVTVVGHSAGGYMGLLATLLGDDLDAEWNRFASSRGGPPQQATCAVEATTTAVSGFVGFNGAYFVFDFVGVPTADPELWRLANPAGYAETHPALVTRFLLGSRDATQPARHLEMVEEFSEARRRAGYDSEVVWVDAEHGYSFDEEPWATTLATILAVASRGR